ncbi:MAG: endopeptidase La, partial [Vicinamibacteria bacterium]
MSDPIENQPPDFESPGFSQSSLSDLPAEIAILPLRDTVLFPEAVLPLAVARDASVTLVNDAVRQQRTIGVLTQKEAGVDDPVEADLFQIGTLTHIHKMFKFPDGTLRLVVQGVGRFRVTEITQYRPYIKAKIEVLRDIDSADKQVEVKALAQAALSMFQKAVDLTPNLPDELKNMAARTTNPSHLADFIASSLPSLTSAQRQELLEVLSVHERLERVNRLLAKDLEVLEVGSKIQNQVKTELQKNQREYYLREQMKAIQKELGDGDDQQREISELREKIEKAEMTEEAKKEALRELDRLTRMPQAAAEYTVTRTYIDWLVSLPWNKRTDVELDIQKAKDVLDADHYGLEKIKDRILEYLAVKKMKPDVKGPILCFVGPPGVGKTSLGKSIASAMGRKFHRMSFGGMRDEAEIRGHRRTYIGALPGQIIQGLRRCESKNPVFMLDEVDKLGHDFRGDPAAALLEVLDPEQNNTFADHYLEIPYDLSNVMFVANANVADPIPPPLRDRMEILEIPGYTRNEKLAIARQHLIPKQIEEHGITKEQLEIADGAVDSIIDHYTREAGVRTLERQVASVIRGVAVKIAE